MGKLRYWVIKEFVWSHLSETVGSGLRPGSLTPESLVLAQIVKIPLLRSILLFPLLWGNEHNKKGVLQIYRQALDKLPAGQDSITHLVCRTLYQQWNWVACQGLDWLTHAHSVCPLKELGQARMMQSGLGPPWGRGNSLGQTGSCKPCVNPWGNLWALEVRVHGEGGPSFLQLSSWRSPCVSATHLGHPPCW